MVQENKLENMALWCIVALGGYPFLIKIDKDNPDIFYWGTSDIANNLSAFSSVDLMEQFYIEDTEVGGQRLEVYYLRNYRLPVAPEEMKCWDDAWLTPTGELYPASQEELSAMLTAIHYNYVEAKSLDTDVAVPWIHIKENGEINIPAVKPTDEQLEVINKLASIETSFARRNRLISGLCKLLDIK